ncbi:MAG: hypothetical protein IPI21_13705 [Propionivibrio sp.]|nr:hypothetical protein [Propionivibrio sp.]
MTDLTESVSALTVTAYGGAAVDGDHPTINYGSSSVNSDIVSTYSIEASVTSTLVASYEINTATSISSYLESSYDIRAAVASDIVANYSILEEVASDFVATYYVSLPDIHNSLDRGTVDLSNSSVTPNGSTPTIAVKNRWFADNSTGARLSFFHVTGVNGLTPVFDVDRSNMENSDASNKFLWSYTGDLGDWHEFGTTTKVSSPNVYRSQHGSAFTQDLVYVAMNYPWRVGYTLPWIESLESSGHIGYAPSGSGSYQFETRSATTNGSTSGVGDVVPAQPLYSFKIGSGGLAPDGLAKRSVVLMGGVHAAEDVGNYVLKGAVEFLVSPDAQAVMVRDWFDIFVYPLVASAGRAGGSTRSDFEDLYKSQDVNRGLGRVHQLWRQ